MTGILSSAPATRTVDTSVAMDKIPEWFPGARLNYAENLLRWAHLRRNVVELSSYFRDEDSLKTLYKCLTFTHRLGTCVLLPPPDRDNALLQVSR